MEVQSWKQKDLKGMLEIFERRVIERLEELLYQKWKKLDKLLEEQTERRNKLFQEAQSKSQLQDLELRSQIPGGFTENGKKTENVVAFTNEDALELCLAQGGKTLQHLEQDFLPHMSSISESAAKKEIVLLDDKIPGDGNVKKSIQKKEQKFQILEDLIQQSFENDVNGANDENTQGFENDNITEASSKVHIRQLDYSMGRIGAEYEVEFLCSMTQRMILPRFRME
ncbi:hypothetical protein GH714_016272 [Hevea brasiliensis]|uniref:Uncharacterized protein n=1 Tax=Hevea brasiliensis TaxID=3981 RepID=A0A6A6K5Y6_HEVBR|nr:hypothetical protein GH714_016272 [Hevea brasiliensis]